MTFGGNEQRKRRLDKEESDSDELHGMKSCAMSELGLSWCICVRAAPPFISRPRGSGLIKPGGWERTDSTSGSSESTWDPPSMVYINSERVVLQNRSRIVHLTIREMRPRRVLAPISISRLSRIVIGSALFGFAQPGPLTWTRKKAAYLYVNIPGMCSGRKSSTQLGVKYLSWYCPSTVNLY